MPRKRQTKILSSSGQVTTNPGQLKSVTIVSDGTNAGEVVIKDNSTDGTGGTIIWRGKVTAAAGDTFSPYLGDGIAFETNAYATLTNTGNVTIGYLDNS